MLRGWFGHVERRAINALEDLNITLVEVVKDMLIKEVIETMILNRI